MKGNKVNKYTCVIESRLDSMTILIDIYSYFGKKIITSTLIETILHSLVYFHMDSLHLPLHYSVARNLHSNKYIAKE